MAAKSKKVLALLLAIILLFSSVSVSGSSELNDKMNEMTQVERKLGNTQKQLDAVVKREKSVMQELGEIEDELAKAEAELKNLEDQLTVVRKRITVVQGELKIAEKNVMVRNDLLGRRIRAIHENGTVSYLEVLLSATTFADFVNRYELLQQIIQGDAVILEEVRVEKANIEEKKKELEIKRSELTALTQSAENQRRTIEVRASDRERLLEQLQSDKVAYKEALDDMEKQSKQLERTIRELQEKAAREAREKAAREKAAQEKAAREAQEKAAQEAPKNQDQEITPKPPSTSSYIWPVNGRITSPFGMRYHPVLKTYRLHTGIDIAASSGTSVKAANSGTVLASGWMGAYGYAIIIDHGGGISTLYAHHSANLVSTGKTVSRGDVIARVGSTGLSTGPHLHFEVRVDGVPKNPMNWLP